MMLNKVSLNTIGLNRIGLNRIGKPSRGSSDRPYIDPEVLASLKAVCICYGKSNDDPDRDVVKNLVDPDNPFIISNAAFKLNSGFGKYSADFESFDWAVNISQKQHNKATISLNGRLCNHTAIEVDEMKVNIIGNVTELIYWYIANPDDTTRSEIRLTSGINTLPKSYAKDDGQTYNIGFAYISGDSEITIEQIPSFEGAFVTDGIDDLITSTKTVQEMLGGSNEITVVSMIHQIGLGCRTNFICDKGSYWRCNKVANTGEGKTGIYGYSSTNISVNTPNIINNVLGDKVDYSVTGDRNDLTPSQFSVVGYISSSGKISYTSSVAWFWTIIANKVLTTDQINQVIAYFNLDRTLKPDILCDVKKQGITNDNHAEFGDKLIDFSGNGRDIQLNNLAWDGDSGIGKYNYPNWKVTATIANTYSTIVNYPTVNGTYSINVNGVSELMQSIGLHLEIKYTTSTEIIYNDIKQDGVYSYILPDGATDLTLRFGGIPGIVNEPCNITITQIPSHAGALCLDGVNDFGKVTGMPVYKDYTVVADREIIDGLAENADGGVALKGSRFLTGAFCFDYKDAAFSFGTPKMIPLDTKRFISYQSKYVSNGISINIGTATDNDELWIGRLGNDERYSKIAIRFLMSFPYSMSEFLIERQLKKHKLGTLYPDMVEFRPIVKSNLPYSSISYSVNPGEYISVDSMVTITVTLPNTSDKLMEVSCNAISDISISGDNGVYEITGKIVKSPQKINLVISSYLTMLNNETLISNETLIKNE